MLEKGEIRKLKGERQTSYTVVSPVLNDDGETVKGYQMRNNSTGGTHWIYEDRIRPKKKKGRRKRP